MKKFFALASVTAVAGIVVAASAAGCSSSSTTTTNDEGGAKTDAKTEGGTVKDGDTDPDTGAGECPGAFPGDNEYKTAAAADITKCDATDIKFMEDEIAAGRSKFVELETSMKARKAACAACIFTKEADSVWGPIVYVGTSGGALQYYGACFARAPGGSDACGKAVQATFDCLDAVCDDQACGGESAVSACTKAALADKTSCGKYNLGTACPNLQSLFDYCEKFTGVISVMCGPGPVARDRKSVV